jgi:hypothetical protein
VSDVGGALDDDDVTLVRTAEAATAAGVTEATIRSWVARGHLRPVARDGSAALFDLDEVYATETRLHVDRSRRPLPVRPAVKRPCVAAPEGEGFCGVASMPGSPAPLCQRHVADVGQFYLRECDDRLGVIMARVQQHRLKDLVTPSDALASVVYFIGRGELIKIGFTSNLHRRMESLLPERIYRLLAGDRVQERALHQVFAADRIRGEWFRRSDDLMSFIDETADQDVTHLVGTPRLWLDFAQAQRHTE